MSRSIAAAGFALAAPLAAFLLAAQVASPVAALESIDDCTPMSANFSFCPADSDWTGARWVQFGDGAALELDAYWLEFTETWVSRQPDATLDEALEALVSELMQDADDEGMDPPLLLLRDGFETEALGVVRLIHDLEPAEAALMPMATMIAEAGGARIMLILSVDTAIPLDEFEDASRAIAALIRPAQEP